VAKTTYKKLYLRCTFTESEMSDLAATMADKTQELKRIDANAKAAAAQFKSDKEAAQNAIDNAARKYRDGYEMRDVECEETLDFESGVVRYWRTDNGDLAQERKMSNEERQMRLDEIAGPDEQQALPAPDGDDSSDPEHDAHVSSVGRFMSQERAVQM
jgi:hypothetical protein